MSVNGPVTRFYNRQTDLDGPVSGALQILYIPMPSIAGAATPEFNIAVPPGMGFTVVDAYFTAAATADTPTIAIGNSSDTTYVVATVTCTTDLGALTIKAAGATVTATSTAETLSVLISATASDTITEGNLTIVGHISKAPTSVI